VLLTATTTIAFFIVLGLIRWFAPHLVKAPTSLEVVQVDTKVQPFYEGIFNAPSSNSEEYLLKDPLTRIRARPFVYNGYNLGPNDILGFRNRSVPNVVDILVIGDSQTYGNNVGLEQNWPSQMSSLFPEDSLSVYAMATGGWGAVQYLDMFNKTVAFQPRIVVVAFYTGNDPLESYSMAYGIKHWNFLIPDHTLSESDMPKIKFPAPESDWMPVTFRDGVKTIFTPKLRHHSNNLSEVVNAGYGIMAETARRITDKARAVGVRVVFTIVPTKELVYRDKVLVEGITVSDDYMNLIRDEQRHIDKLVEQIRQMKDAVFIDMVKPLQLAAMKSISLYPINTNGHPVDAGYGVIGAAITRGLKEYIPKTPEGVVAVKVGDQKYNVGLIMGKSIKYFKSPDILVANGWQVNDARIVEIRDVSRLKNAGVINVVEPEKYGPIKD